MKRYECLQIEDYKKKRRGGRISYGKCAILYHVELDGNGRAVWVREFDAVWWATGYSDADVRVKDAASLIYPSLPWIQTANHRKLVSKSEAQKLLGKHWLPAAALDYLTENVVNPEPKTEVEI